MGCVSSLPGNITVDTECIKWSVQSKFTILEDFQDFAHTGCQIEHSDLIHECKLSQGQHYILRQAQLFYFESVKQWRVLHCRFIGLFKGLLLFIVFNL